MNISIKIVHFPLFKEKLYSIFDMTRLGRLKGILKLQIIGVGAFEPIVGSTVYSTYQRVCKHWICGTYKTSLMQVEQTTN